MPIFTYIILIISISITTYNIGGYYPAIAAASTTYISTTGGANYINTKLDKYQTCAQLSKEAPEQAVQYADSWLSSKPSDEETLAAAIHCKAISLFGARKYELAAVNLDRLYNEISANNKILRLAIKRQSAKAWELAQKPYKAIESLTTAIKGVKYDYSKNNRFRNSLIRLLSDRASLYVQIESYLDAIQDLDYIESILTFGDITTSDKKTLEHILLRRARIYNNMGLLDSAIQDVQTVQRHNPSSQQAQSLLQEMLENSR